MATILVPFKGAEGKRRLAPATPEARVALGLAMLADVLAAAAAVAPTTVVTNDEAAWRVAAELEVDVLAGVPTGQGPAVEAALRRLEPVGPVLVVNADLPCVQPDDLRALLDAVPSGGFALAAAADGTTNALALADAALFEPARARRWRLRWPASRPRREDRRPRGRRRWRPVRARRRRERAACGRDRCGKRRRRPRGARPARLARPGQRPVRARRPERRGARLGARGRDLERARHGGRARRRDVVPARRPRHRPPSRPHPGAAGGQAALRDDRAARSCARRRDGDPP